MGTRREAREWAVQLLFQLDLNPDSADTAFEDFWTSREADAESRAFVDEVVSGTRARLDEIDASLRRYAENWAVNRMGVIERNVLRMALFEMYFRLDIPPVVTINEAVDLAKYFGSAESGRFINGILDRARKDLDRPSRSSAGGR